MNTDPVAVSFVLLEFHSLEDIHFCINSIREKVSDICFEIIVSSNSSYAPGQQNQISAADPSVKWVFNAANLGFAGGMNAGIKHAGNSEFVVILNQDVRILSANFDQLIAWFRIHDEIGVIGTKIINNKGDLQDTFRKFITPVRLLTRQAKRYYYKKPAIFEYEDHESVIRVDWVCGGFMIIRKKILVETGLLDESYFLYVEDMDLCYRVWESGYEIVYYPFFTVEYQGDRKSIKFLIDEKLQTKYLRYHLKSYFLFLKKHQLLSRKYFYRKLQRQINLKRSKG